MILKKKNKFLIVFSLVLLLLIPSVLSINFVYNISNFGTDWVKFDFNKNESASPPDDVNCSACDYRFLLVIDEANLNVNSSTYCDETDPLWSANYTAHTWNETDWVKAQGYGTSTIDDNRTWNQSHASTLYADIGAGVSDNKTWNQSGAYGLYINKDGLTENWDAGAYNITVDFLKGNVIWNNLTDYPVACPAGSAITQLDDSVTCTAINSMETDPQWSSNLTNMETDCPVGNYSYGVFSNGSFKCRDDTTSAAGADTQKQADDIYIYNDSTTIYLNSTLMNQTILNISSRFNETSWVEAQGYGAGGGADNTTWNQSGASDIFVDIENNYDITGEGLILAMNFNSETVDKNKVLDSSGQNYHGANYGATHNTTGGFNGGGYYFFDGDKISLTTLALKKENSASFWIDYQDTEGAVIIGGSNEYMPYISSGAIGGIIYYNAGQSYVGVVHGGLESGTWNHIAISRDGTSVKFYKNGAQIGATQTLGADNDITINTIGSFSGGTFPFEGKLDEIRLYNRSLSADEIKNLYLQKAEIHNSFVTQKGIIEDTEHNVNVTYNMEVTGKTKHFNLTYMGTEIIGTIAPVFLGYQGSLTGYGAAIGVYLDSGSSTTSRGITVWDKRTSTHQPSIAVVSPNGQDIFGMKWNGAGGVAIFDTLAGDIELKPYLNVGIKTATPTYPLEVNANVNGISIWSSANVSATGYNTRTSIYDKSQGSALDKIQDADYYKTNNKINHSKFYGYAGTTIITDYDKPIIKSHIELICDGGDFEELFNCRNETINITTYPYKKEVEQVSLNKEIDVLRQAVYELKEENDLIKEENNLMKSELCKKDNTYIWCKYGVIK